MSAATRRQIHRTTSKRSYHNVSLSHHSIKRSSVRRSRGPPCLDGLAPYLATCRLLMAPAGAQVLDILGLGSTFVSAVLLSRAGGTHDVRYEGAGCRGG